MHKMTVQYFEPADAEAFIAAYRERHVPLVQAVPGVERFTLSHPNGEEAPYMVAELWFADEGAMGEALGSAELAAAAADAETYAVARRTLHLGAVEDVTV